MTINPVNWIAFHEARQRIPTLASGWMYVSQGADAAMVYLLRRRNIEYHIEKAKGLGRRAKSVDPAVVIRGLLNLWWPGSMLPHEVAANELKNNPDYLWRYDDLDLYFANSEWELESSHSNAVIAEYESTEQRRVLALGGYSA